MFTEEKIRQIRKNLGLSMEEFGKLFNPPASKGGVSNWENGYNLPNNERLKRIAELGNTSVAEILKPPPEPEEMTLAGQLGDLFRSYNLRVGYEHDYEIDQEYYTILFPYDEHEPIKLTKEEYLKKGNELLKSIQMKKDSLVSNFLDFEVEDIDSEFNWPDEYSEYY